MQPPPALAIPTPCMAAMIAHVSRLAPLEACGLLGGHAQRVGLVLPVANALASPVRFRMDAREQLTAMELIEALGMDLLGIFHSHPEGPPAPSATDIAEAAYPVVNLIWFRQDQGWRVRGFWISEGGFRDVPLHWV